MTEIVVLANEGSAHHARPFVEHFGARVRVESDWRPAAIAAHEPELVVTFDEHDSVLGMCSAEMTRQGTATLQVMDGILEWRRTWAYPTSARKRPLNQPVLSHKLACLGRADARVMESWGNVGKCEVVGSPRLDPLVRERKEVRAEPVTQRPLRLLVMTAKTPGFTEEQVETTLRSLADVRDAVATRADVEVVWRVTQDTHKRLGVRNTMQELTGMDLRSVLRSVDAALTTPSTAMLEAMLAGLPTALLDYHNCPHYVPAAWRVTCREQVLPVVEELRAPSESRRLYQEFCLDDALSCRSEAMPRMARLVEAMLAVRREARARGDRALSFPHRLLDDPDDHVSWPAAGFDLRKLYPTHAVFARMDLAAMQAELEAALGTVERLSAQVATLTGRLHRIPGYKFAGRLRKHFAR